MENEDVKYRPYQVPIHIADAAEKEARIQRMKTGENIGWTELVREALEKRFIK